jgi:hypothetical protein
VNPCKETPPWLNKIREKYEGLESNVDDALIEKMRPGLKAALDAGLKASCDPQTILNRSREAAVRLGQQPLCLAVLQVWAYLEKKTGKKLKVEGGEEIPY